MTEKELINKIKEFNQIKPQKDWVFLTKARILGEEIDRGQAPVIFFPFFKQSLAFITVFAIFFGLFGFAQSSVPGDLLYPVKKIAERGQGVFVTEQNKPQNSLDLANKRLEELTKIVESNQVKKLGPAINEFQASVSEAAKKISIMETTSFDPIATRSIVDKIKKMEFKIEEIRSLGVVINDDELQGISVKSEVRLLISDLENRTLTEEEKDVLIQMKDLAKQEKYSDVLELFLLEFNKEQELEQELEIEQEIE